MYQSTRDMALHPHLAAVALKRTPVARGKTAPRVSSIVGSFFPLPWLASVADTVASRVCPLARAAAQASPAAIGEDVQSDSRRATTPDGRAGMETVEPSPRFDEPTQLFHGGWSD